MAHRRKKEGTTLVETMVAVMLLMIMLVMIVGIVSPAFRVFIRMQRVQFARMILDNVTEDLKDELREATTYVKIYSGENGGSGILDAAGVSEGKVLEYVNTEGYVVLVSAGGCRETAIYRGEQRTEDFPAVPAGQLLYRYYWGRGSDGTDDTVAAKGVYYYLVNGAPAARAATTAFGSGYYMGNYLQIVFAFSNELCDNNTVKGIQVHAKLYQSAEMKEEELLAQEDFVVDFRYKVVREDKKTAVAGTIQQAAL